MKKTATKFLSLVAAAALPFTAVAGMSFTASAEEPIKVACVGDSITQGLGNTPYPSRLGDLLGEGYEVGNYGLYATTVCNNTGRPYTTCEDSCYQASLDFAPNVVIIMLGTNDGNEGNIANAEQYFKQDMTSLVNSYKALPTNPDIYLVTSPYAYIAGNAAVNTKIVQMQRELADELGLPLVDMNKLTENMPENFQDGLHPSETGYYIVAQNIYEHVFGGKVADVTVKTSPEAKVKLNAYEVIADAEGVAKLRMAQGKRLITVVKDGFENAFAEIDITGNCVIDCTLKQAVNMVADGTPVLNGTGDAANAFDSDFSTGWQNENKTAGISVGVEFDKNRTFSSVKLYWETVTRPTADSSGYVIECYDGEKWTAVENASYNYGTTDYNISCDTVTFETIAAKGVRVVINSFTNEKYAPSLYEMGVYGDNTGEAEIKVTNAEQNDAPVVSEPEKDEATGLPKWVIPVAAGVVGLIIIACIVWAVVTSKNRTGV